MTGIEDLNLPEFTACAAEIRGCGYDVIIPHESDKPDAEWADHVVLDLAHLASVGAGVVLLDGWRNAPACVMEVGVAALLGLSVLEWRGKNFVFRPDRDDPRAFLASLLGCEVAA